MKTANILVYSSYKTDAVQWEEEVIYTDGAWHHPVDYESDFAVPNSEENRNSIKKTGKHSYWSESYARDPNGETKKWVQAIDLRGKDY